MTLRWSNYLHSGPHLIPGGSQYFSTKWIILLYRSPSAVVQVNGRLSLAFTLSWSVRQCCPLSSLLYALTLGPLIRRLKDAASSLALRRIIVPGTVSHGPMTFSYCRRIPGWISVRYEKIMGP